uniref:acid phosphatase n=1 Tax=Timema genevievae TaxID=629358 RepID=A0A7R9PMD0_TIMGE|nr:unnamed protein product [Timema genevievae]
MFLKCMLVIACLHENNGFIKEDIGSLIFVNVLYRHGDRTPLDPYPNDPFRNTSLWPVGWGQLTPEGAKQQYLLGKWLRQRYIDFLPTKYDADNIHIRSTDVDRTLMSAESNLAGLYPPVSKQQISKELKWQPIPIHTIPESLDYLLAAKKLCPAYEEELIRMKNSPEMIDLDKINAELYAYLTNHTGRKISNVEDVEYLYNTLLIEEKYNFTLPEWTKSVYPDKMKPLAEIDFVVPTKTTLLKRLKSGPLLEEMVSNMKKKSENRLVPNRKMFVYSGHDTTVANLLNTLGVFDPQCPPYDALVLIELRKNSAGKYFVSVMVTLHFPQLLCIVERFLLTAKKINDLRNVVHFVPDEHKEFYDNILLCPITPTQADKVEEDRD